MQHGTFLRVSFAFWGYSLFDQTLWDVLNAIVLFMPALRQDFFFVERDAWINSWTEAKHEALT